MPTLKLTAQELLDLQQELQFLVRLKLPIRTKFDLTELLVRINSRASVYQKTIDDIINQYGYFDEKTQKMTIQLFSDTTMKEKSEPYKLIEEIQEQECEIEYESKFKISMFDGVESEMNFPAFFKLVDAN